MKLLIALTVGFVRTLVDAWALLCLWGWFVVPLGAPSITFWHAAGLDMIAGLFMLCAARRVPDEDQDFAADMGFALGKVTSVALVVGAGFLVHLGMR